MDFPTKLGFSPRAILNAMAKRKKKFMPLLGIEIGFMSPLIGHNTDMYSVTK
jgi:hypothetical protein